jgi:hypothetical protein
VDGPVVVRSSLGWGGMETRSQRTKGEGKDPVGGYEPVSVFQIASSWWAYREGSIRKLDLRVWWAAWELEVRRRLSNAKYRPNLDDLGRLVGSEPGQGGLTSSLGRLEEAGLLRFSKDGVSFARSEDELSLRDPVGFSSMLGLMPSPRRVVPVPRRMIRRLAGGLSRSRTAVVLAHFIRCLFYRRGEGCSSSGSAKASWIAEAFGLTERSVYDARQYLVTELGWLIPQECSQHTLNRDGLWVTIDLAWGPDGSDAGSPAAKEECPQPALPGNDFSGPRADLPAGFSGPIQDKAPPPREELKDQKPAERGPTGFSIQDGKKTPEKTPEKASSKAPTLRDITRDDLKETSRLVTLFDQAVKEGLISGSEADRLKFMSAAVHAQAVGSEPPRLFAWLVRERRWNYITQADEDEANSRLKRWMNPPVEPRASQGLEALGRPSQRPPKRVLSKDALVVEHLTNELRKRGINRDAFLVVRPHLPADWTRERWDRATLELAGSGVPSDDSMRRNSPDSREKRS